MSGGRGAMDGGWRDQRAADGLSADWAAPFLPEDESPPRRSSGGGDGHPGESGVAWYTPLVGRLLMLFAVGAIVGAIFWGLLGVGVTKRETLPPAVLKLDTANPTIAIENVAGAVRVLPGSADEVRITQTIEVQHLSSDLAQRGLDAARIAPPTRGPDGVVRIVSRPAIDLGFFFHRDVDTVIYIPPTATLRLNVEAGSATVERASGPITATVSGGHLELLGVKIGAGSTLDVNAGNARLDGELLPGATLKATVNAGNATITLPRATAASFSGTVNSGNLSVDEWTNVKADTPASRRQGAVRSYSGYLYTDPTAPGQSVQGQITIVVNSGNATLQPADAGASAAPAIPTVQPLPSVPPAPPAR